MALPNGVDVELFVPRKIDRGALWQRTLVQQPQGWLPGRPPGSLRYHETEARQLPAGSPPGDVGRFHRRETEGIRFDRCFRLGAARTGAPVGLVLVGGHPGEWEGEHPADIAARVGAPRVFLAGWHAQQDLPEFLSAADAIVLTSEREQFGQVLIEAMACGVPAVATRSLGPAAIIEDRRTGWLVEPDDEAALAAALTEVVNDPDERARKGRSRASSGAQASSRGQRSRQTSRPCSKKPSTTAPPATTPEHDT